MEYIHYFLFFTLSDPPLNCTTRLTGQSPLRRQEIPDIRQILLDNRILSARSCTNEMQDPKRP